MPKKFKLTEEKATNAPVEKIEWEGEQIETEAQPLVNDGSGRPIILRAFEFSLPPNVAERPNKQQLLEFHKSKITAFLWKDELVPIQDFRLVYSKDQNHFRIFVTCQAKAGATFLETPQLLQNIPNGRPS